jgi:hypothetical protein
MADDLERLPQAIDLGARTGRIIRQNIALAIGIKVVVFALAAVGMATLWMAVLADMGTSQLVIFQTTAFATGFARGIFRDINHAAVEPSSTPHRSLDGACLPGLRILGIFAPVEHLKVGRFCQLC